MTDLIKGYEVSCRLARERISQLTEQMNTLRNQGDTVRIEELDLERRIRLLYIECRQMEEIIRHLTSCARRTGYIVET